MTATVNRSKPDLHRAQHDAERDDWIRQHGSEHLRLALELGYSAASEKVYVSERLRLERGDAWGICPRPGDLRHPLNPPLSALVALKVMRALPGGAQVALGYVAASDGFERNAYVLHDQPSWSRWTCYSVIA